MTILHIDSSINGESSASRAITAAIVGNLTAASPGANVVYRDLAARRTGEEREILLALADAEGRHEAHWLDLLGGEAYVDRPGPVGVAAQVALALQLLELVGDAGR